MWISIIFLRVASTFVMVIIALHVTIWDKLLNFVSLKIFLLKISFVCQYVIVVAEGFGYRAILVIPFGLLTVLQDIRCIQNILFVMMTTQWHTIHSIFHVS